MSAKYHHFQIGQAACTVLLEGASQLDVERFVQRFPDATEAEYRQAFADIGSSLDDADNSMNMLLFRLGDDVVLVDTGMRGLLLDSMALAGFLPEDVTLVIITHADGDHVIGLLTDAGQPTFPNATYVISKQNMAFWPSRINSSAPEQQAIVDMMQAKGLRQIEMDETIMAGLTAVPIPGHKPGQIGLLLESDGERMIHLADLLHSPIQFGHPEWSAAFDVDTRLSVPTRREALVRAADENLLALFYHLTFPGLGRVRRSGPAFTWEPLA